MACDDITHPSLTAPSPISSPSPPSRLSGPRLELRAADAAPENNGAHAHTEDEALAPLPSPPSPAPPHGSAPPVQALVARALQKSMVNQTPLALTVMAPEPVPLKVYQASFVVKVRVVPAQPALSCASPLPELSLRPCPSVWAAAEQGKTAALQTAVLHDVFCSCEMLCMVCTEMMVLTTPTTFRLPTPVSLAPRGAWARSRRRRSPSSPLPPWRRRRCGRPARGRRPAAAVCFRGTMTAPRWCARGRARRIVPPL